MSMIQMANGSLTEIRDMVIRLRQLSVNAASDTISDVERDLLQIETQQTLTEIDRAAHISVLFGHQLLRGQDKVLEFQVDAGSGNTSRLRLDLGKLEQTTQKLGIAGINLSQKYSAQSAIEKMDKAVDQVADVSARLGAFQNRLVSTETKLGIDVENFKAANSRLIDADYGQETASYVSDRIREKASVMVASQGNVELKQALKLIE